VKEAVPVACEASAAGKLTFSEIVLKKKKTEANQLKNEK